MTQYEGTKLADFTPIAKVDALQIIDIIPGTGRSASRRDYHRTLHWCTV